MAGLVGTNRTRPLACSGAGSNHRSRRALRAPRLAGSAALELFHAPRTDLGKAVVARTIRTCGVTRPPMGGAGQLGRTARARRLRTRSSQLRNDPLNVSPLRRRLGTVIIALGFDPRRTWRSLRFLLGYLRDVRKWRQGLKQARGPNFAFHLLPTLSERYANSGVASGHYFHQDLWAARQIFERAPLRHLDVGSRIDGFVAHLLAFRTVEVVDIRALDSRISGLSFQQADLMAATPPSIRPAESVSCLHALEHFGLGRYGDPVAPDGWQTGLRNLCSLVADNGLLYVGVPIGRPAVEFNAQRIFDPRYIVTEARRHGLHLLAFAHVDDAGDLHEQANEPLDAHLAQLARLDYGCGLYVFQKQVRVSAP